VFSDYWEQQIWELQDKVFALRSILHDVQWGSLPHYENSECPYCLNEKRDGHTEDCRIALFLTRHPL